MISLVDGIFWGAAFIIVGVWFIVRHYVPVHIPLGRIIIALLFIYVGVRVLVHGPFIQDKNTVVFSDSRLGPEDTGRGGDYTILFSRGFVDLSTLRPSGGTVRKEVNVIFGSGVLKIDPSAPVRIDMSAAFGTVQAPNGRAAAFGDSLFTTASYREGSDCLRIKATAVFGTLRIQE
jgi:hypothetical protein